MKKSIHVWKIHDFGDRNGTEAEPRRNSNYENNITRFSI